MATAVDLLTGGPANPVSAFYPLGAPAQSGISRERRTLLRGSPLYPISLGVLAAGATNHYSLEDTPALAQALKYDHLDFIEVINNDDVDLRLTVGEDQKIYCPSGSVQKLTDKPFRNFRITNLDAAVDTTALKVEILVRREPINQDKLIRRRL